MIIWLQYTIINAFIHKPTNIYLDNALECHADSALLNSNTSCNVSITEMFETIYFSLNLVADHIWIIVDHNGSYLDLVDHSRRSSGSWGIIVGHSSGSGGS